MYYFVVLIMIKNNDEKNGTVNMQLANFSTVVRVRNIISQVNCLSPVS